MRGTRPEARPQHMSDDLKFQLRLTLSDEFAKWPERSGRSVDFYADGYIERA